MPEVLAAVARVPSASMEIVPVRLDDPRPDELIVEVRAAGICHSDLAGRDQYMPFPLPGVLGHEGAGIVRAVGSAVTRVAIGDRVVMSQAFCGTCQTCAEGRVTACPHAGTLSLSGVRADGTGTIADSEGRPLSGGFLGQSSWATHALVREANVVGIDDGLPWEVAASMACGVQTGAGAILNVLKPRSADAVVVFGAGTVGLSAVMAARHGGSETVIVSDPQPHRLELARELGATHTLDPTSVDVVDAVRDLANGGASFAIEASGALAAGAAAVRCLDRTGTCLLLGVPPFGTPIELDWIGLVSGQTILGVPYGGGSPSTTISSLLEIRASGGLPVEKLIKTYPFDQVGQAIADMEAGVALKPVLLLDPT